MNFSLDTFIIVSWLISPFVLHFHLGYSYSLVAFKKMDAKQAIRHWLTYLPYVTLYLYSAYDWAIRLAEIEGGETHLKVVGFVLIAILIPLVFLMCSALIGHVLFETFLDSCMFEPKGMGERVIKHLINKHYSPHITSLVDTFFKRQFIEVVSHSNELETVYGHEHPTGHPHMAKSMVTLVNVLLENQHNPAMRSVIEDAMVSGDRINRLAFVLNIFQDEAKFKVVSEVYNPDYDDDFGVIKEIAQELEEELKTFVKLKEKTKKNAEELSKQAIQKEIAELKKSSQSFNFSPTD